MFGREYELLKKLLKYTSDDLILKQKLLFSDKKFHLYFLMFLNFFLKKKIFESKFFFCISFIIIS